MKIAKMNFMMKNKLEKVVCMMPKLWFKAKKLLELLPRILMIKIEKVIIVKVIRLELSLMRIIWVKFLKIKKISDKKLIIQVIISRFLLIKCSPKFKRILLLPMKNNFPPSAKKKKSTPMNNIQLINNINNLPKINNNILHFNKLQKVLFMELKKEIED
jgi:hypothetical protein